MKAHFSIFLTLCCCLFVQLAQAQLQPADFAMNLNAATNGECNGAISLQINQASPYTFEWSNGATSQDLQGLCPGIYGVTITERDGCSWTLEGQVDGEGGCFLRSTPLDATITDYCFPELGAVKLNLPVNPRYTYSWDNGGQAAEITDLQPGRYCVTIDDTEEFECMAFACFDIVDKECNVLNTGNPPVLVNEFSSGPNGVEEYIELLVVGDGSCTPVDIRGFMLDDNDGSFSRNGYSGTGISPGHVRFSYEGTWAAVPVGALILIYDAQNKNPEIKLVDDPEDVNNDLVYVIPSTHRLLETQSQYPNPAQPHTYTIKGTTRTYTPGGDWSTMRLYNYADALQVRYPDGSYAHGMSYGIPSLMSGGPDNLHLLPSSARVRVFSFLAGSHQQSTNYAVGFTDRGSETPGEPNSPENASFIDGLCGRAPFNNVFNVVHDQLGSATFYPNPFSDRIEMELEWTEAAAVELRFYDLLGQVVVVYPLELVKGYNQFSLDVPGSLPAGLYHLAVAQNNKVVLSQKMVRTLSGR